MAANIITIQRGGSFLEQLTGKEIKGTQIGKEEGNRHYLHMLCLPLWKHPEGPQKIKEFNTFAGFKINIQRLRCC